jgi:hypothetical protein
LLVYHPQWKLQQTPVNSFGLPHLESVLALPLTSHSEIESLSSIYKYSSVVYEGAEPFSLQTLPSQGYDCSHP